MIKDRLDYFALAYESPNFSVAASKVPMSPQGFSKSINGLERDLGVTLFEQDEAGRRQPTAYADELYTYAKRAQAERALLQHRFDAIAEKHSEHIRLVASLGIIGMLGSHFIRDFEERHPGTVVTVTEVPDATCDRLLRDGSFEIALTIQPTGSDLRTTVLYETQTAIWLRDDHPLANRETLLVRDLSGESLATPGNFFKCRHAVKTYFLREGLPMPQFTDFSEIFWIYDFVQRGNGIGFSVPHLCKLPVFNQDPHIVSRLLPEIPWAFGVSFLENYQPSEIESQFIAYLASKAAKLPDGLGQIAATERDKTINFATRQPTLAKEGAHPVASFEQKFGVSASSIIDERKTYDDLRYDALVGRMRERGTL